MSLRARLTYLLIGGIGVPLILGGALVGILVPQWLHDEFDDALETRASALQSLSIVDDGEIEIEFSDAAMPEFEDDEEPYYFELWLGGDELLEASRSFYPRRGLRLPKLPRLPDFADEERFTDLRLPDGRPGRLVQLDFVPEIEDDEDDEEDDPEEEPFEEDEPEILPSEALASGAHPIMTVLVAGSTTRLDGQVMAMRVGAAVGTVALLLALAAIVRLALRVGLRPVDGVVGQVASMNAESLGQRIDTAGTPEELLPLLQQLNEFIDRLGIAFRRERQLTADMAHELKTPIAELRSLSEVGERWPDDRESVVRFFADARNVACQMERVVVHLLALARHDAGQQVVRKEELDLDALVTSAWRPFAKPAAERGLSLHVNLPRDARVQGDPEMLGMILSNLFSNAVAYSRPDTTIACTAASEAGAVRLSVRNVAQDLDEHDLEVMFDRFWRKDSSRTGASAGLGLSLVRAFASVLDVEVGASLAVDGTFEVVLTVPAPEIRSALPPRAAAGA